MKKVAALLVATMILGFSFVAMAEKSSEGVSTGGTVKIGYVDMNRALNEVREGKSAKAQLEADGRAKKQKLEIMQNEIKAMKEDLDKQKLILSKDALQQKEAQFQQKFYEMQKMTVDFEREFAEKEANLIKPIGMRLQTVIQKIGTDEGYTIIVPREMALYSLPGADLTDKVIKSFDGGK
ncbi:MAG: OmpH family outer membrane protein [bacterium]